MIEPLRHIKNPLFGGVIFRQTYKQIRSEGALWDESQGIYRFANGEPKETSLEWQFPSGAKITFSHMEHEKNKYDWQGAQVCFIGFDELTHFSRSQFFYMLSRNRSICGVKPYIRATTNPDADSWVSDFISWYIDQETGYAIPERSGVIRYFIVDASGQIIWSDKKDELENAKSFTFIRSSLDDNQILLSKDPSYRANLNSLSLVDRARLRDGNWKIRETSGNFFKKEWFEIIDTLPADRISFVRYWDRAGTKKILEGVKKNDPDFTVGIKMSMTRQGMFIIENVVRFQENPAEVEKRIKTIASQDGIETSIGLEQEPGSSGKSEARYLARQLAGYSVSLYPAVQSKVVRAKPVSSQAEIGNIKLLRASWNQTYLDEMENFPPQKGKDDQVDATSGALAMLSQAMPGVEFL